MQARNHVKNQTWFPKQALNGFSNIDKRAIGFVKINYLYTQRTFMYVESLYRCSWMRTVFELCLLKTVFSVELSSWIQNNDKRSLTM